MLKKKREREDRYIKCVFTHNLLQLVIPEENQNLIGILEELPYSECQ